MIDIIKNALSKGARIYSNISGGKDGQAMSRVLRSNQIPIEGFIHCDLGRVEWPESMLMCRQTEAIYQRPLYVLKRADDQDLMDRMENRLQKLANTKDPFWPSKSQRYCTSDMKRDQADKFYRNCGNNLVISAEGIRAAEGKERAKKIPLTIRQKVSSSFYSGMTVEEALMNYRPGKRLVLTWYPIFGYSTEEVWKTHSMTSDRLTEARAIYKRSGQVPHWWPFHPAYVYGNDRVSCMFCIMASENDLRTGKKHNPGLYEQLVEMEDRGRATFKNGWSLKALR